MTQEDVDYLDKHKSDDKEWTLLRNEPDVFFVTRDDLVGLPKEIEKQFAEIANEPLKGRELRIYNYCVKIMEDGFKRGTIKLKR